MAVSSVFALLIAAVLFGQSSAYTYCYNCGQYLCSSSEYCCGCGCCTYGYAIWWVWLLVVLGIMLIFGIVFACIRRRRMRALELSSGTATAAVVVPPVYGAATTTQYYQAQPAGYAAYPQQQGYPPQQQYYQQGYPPQQQYPPQGYTEGEKPPAYANAPQ
eukprot:Opistho-2@4360